MKQQQFNGKGTVLSSSKDERSERPLCVSGRPGSGEISLNLVDLMEFLDLQPGETLEQRKPQQLRAEEAFARRPLQQISLSRGLKSIPDSDWYSQDSQNSNDHVELQVEGVGGLP